MMTKQEIYDEFGYFDPTDFDDEDYKIVEIDTIRAESSRALLIDFGDKEEWIAKSLCKVGIHITDLVPTIAIKTWKFNQLNLSDLSDLT
jgi:hypothetical protein